MALFASIHFKRAVLDWRRTYVLGVLNVTPDSFSDGGQLADADAAVARGLELARAGADVVDVGGESTRPGAIEVPAEAEWARVSSVIGKLAGCITVSIDTYKAEVAVRALESGAEIVNDVSGGALDPEILKVTARHGAAIILGHLRGRPREMNEQIAFSDVVREVVDELAERIARAQEAGVRRDRIFIDPGLGFGKLAEHSLRLLGELRALDALACPIVIGASRKSFLGKVTGQGTEGREIATAAAHAIAIWNGAHMVRVHDVARQRDAIRVADAVHAAIAADHGIDAGPLVDKPDARHP